jgi:hypothetical protein
MLDTAGRERKESWGLGRGFDRAVRVLAPTYVIRAGAVPAGRGPIVYSNYTILGANFLFAEVRPDTGNVP